MDASTDRPPLIRALLEPAAYPHGVEEISLVETHISWVLLTGEFAYKVKKPVDLGFLDFSSLELRRSYCDEELRVNRRTAPDLYINVVPIGRDGGTFRVGREPAVEYAVRMRQFPHDARLDRCLKAGRVGREESRELAATIARFHEGLEPRERSDFDLEQMLFRLVNDTLLDEEARAGRADSRARPSGPFPGRWTGSPGTGPGAAQPRGSGL